MSKPFHLSILTPERSFFEGDVYSITVQCTDGRLSVLADHIPMLTVLSVGALTIESAKGKREAFHSEGYMEVTHKGVTMFAQACEWPEEIDKARAREAAMRAKDRLGERMELNEDRSKVALLRALTRLQVGDRASLM